MTFGTKILKTFPATKGDHMEATYPHPQYFAKCQPQHYGEKMDWVQARYIPAAGGGHELVVG